MLGDVGTTDLFGWIAALLTLAAMAMQTMMPLRVFASVASGVFLLGSALSGSVILAALAAAILCANLFRLLQLHRSTAEVANARDGAFNLEWIEDVMRPVDFSDGEIIFRKGDAPHYIYFLHEGSVLLEEIGIKLGPGDIFGEIAFFSATKERTLTARCTGKCKIMVIRESDFMKLHAQNPAFGLFVLRLVASRLLDGVENNPDAYKPISPLERKRRDG
ncbi:MAG: cyclic nucleotide-binding domain-containing protein [Pseudomonadota bacterium]